MGAAAPQITSLMIAYSTVYSGADQRKHQSPASLAFVRGIPLTTHKGPVTRKMFPFDDVVMFSNANYNPFGMNSYMPIAFITTTIIIIIIIIIIITISSSPS